jgi:hypothetical protein
MPFPVFLFCTGLFNTISSSADGAWYTGSSELGGISAGSACAAFVNTFRAKNASTGDRSMVPPIGGMMPRNRFRYGSQIVLQKVQGAC